jgi:hypothetical protein
MDPRGRKPHSPSVRSSHAAKVVVVVVEFYEDFVPEEEKATMSSLEAEVHLIMEFKDDEEVKFQVGGLIPDLGCTRTRNSKLFCTLELY